METLTEEKNAVVGKIEELCEALVSQPGFEKMKQDIERFEADAAAQKQYNELLSQQEQLQKKQQAGQALSNQDIRDFEEGREALFANEVAKNYLDAQQQMQNVQQTAVKYLTKTFELGRVPLEEDLQSGGCCGGGCGGGGCGTC